MSEYVTKSDGPGSIGALVSGAALSHPPTIGSNAPIRDVRAMTHGATPVPAMSGGCGCGNDNGNGNGGSNMGWLLIPAALVVGIWAIKKM